LPVGWPADAPYDIVLIDGTVPEIPAAVAGQLNRQTGRLLTIVGPNVSAPGRQRTAIAVHAEPTAGGVSMRALFDVLCPVLPGFASAPAFEF
jgi:protein-L-isoaspartate(D-aspartate) O-methyltransferase